jgi:hypothetical protein
MDENKAIKLVDRVLFPSIFIGEGMQVATQRGAMDYNFLTGHLSDFALAGYATSWGLELTKGKGRIARFLGATLPAALFTLREYVPVIPLEDTVDHWDTACYWAAAGAVTGVVKYLSDDDFRYKVNSAIQKINPFHRKFSNLDEVLNQHDTTPTDYHP